jgi:hypothetical protein
MVKLKLIGFFNNESFLTQVFLKRRNIRFFRLKEHFKLKPEGLPKYSSLLSLIEENLNDLDSKKVYTLDKSVI